MHPPLFQPHPLCQQEVNDLVRCHEEHPYMKFLNACGGPKIALDMCFREEKKLRIKLSDRLPQKHILSNINEMNDKVNANLSSSEPKP